MSLKWLVPGTCPLFRGSTVLEVVFESFSKVLANVLDPNLEHIFVYPMTFIICNWPCTIQCCCGCMKLENVACSNVAKMLHSVWPPLNTSSNDLRDCLFSLL